MGTSRRKTTTAIYERNCKSCGVQELRRSKQEDCCHLISGLLTEDNGGDGMHLWQTPLSTSTYLLLQFSMRTHPCGSSMHYRLRWWCLVRVIQFLTRLWSAWDVVFGPRPFYNQQTDTTLNFLIFSAIKINSKIAFLAPVPFLNHIVTGWGIFHAWHTINNIQSVEDYWHKDFCCAIRHFGGLYISEL